MISFPKQRAHLALGLGVCLFAVVVVVYSQQATEIGLTCAFETKVQRIYPDYLPEDLAFPRRPVEGDLILSVAGVPVQSWAGFLRTISQLRSTEAFRDRPEVGSASGLPALEEMARSGASLVRRGNQDLVRVVFQSPAATGRSGYCWCVIGTPPPAEFLPSIAWFFVKVGLLLVGAVVYWRRPRDESAFRFYLLCVCSVGAFMGGYHWLRIASSPLLLLIFMTCALLLPVVSLHFYLVYPAKKEFLKKHPGWTLGLVYGPPLILFLIMAATLITNVLLNRLGADPATVVTFSQVLLREIYFAIGLAAVWFLACIFSLVHSLYAAPANSQARNQVKWILTGALLAAGPIGYTLYLAITNPEDFGLGGGTWPMFTASLLISAAYAISISRYGLMEVREVLNLGTLTIGASVAAGLLYAGIVFIGMFFLDSREIALSPLWQATWVSVTAWVVLTMLHLARSRLRQVLHRRLHRTKFQLDQTLRQLNEAVEQRIDPQLLCRRFLSALAELADFEQGAIYLRQGDPPSFKLVSHLGEEPAIKELAPGSPLIDTLAQTPLLRLRSAPGTVPLEPAQRQLRQLQCVTALPLRHEGQMLAVLLVGPMEGSLGDVESLHLLTTFAQIAGLALHSTEGQQQVELLGRELQAKVDQVAEQQRRIVALQGQLRRQTAPEADALAKAAPPGQEPPASPSEMVGGSDAMRHLLHLTRKVAASPSAVLIRGESGTGKELLARAIHEWGPRCKGPFVKVHCAALSPGLMESELFGHVKGAFTSAHKDKVGRFELADGGTLFLDEIGDINLEIQTKLLRVLQEMSFERVGSSTPIMVDVRVVAATNQDLERLMKEGKFREDLFFRLNVITLRTPPLRERKEDIAELAQHFLREYAVKCGKPMLTQIDDEVLAALKGHSWPGNVRELENVIERAVVLAEGDSITLAELPEEIRQPAPRGDAGNASNLRLVEPQVAIADWQAEFEEKERRRLVQALAAAGGNKARAARSLNLPRSTFVSKLEKHGLLPRRV